MASRTMREIAAKHNAELKRLGQPQDSDDVTETETETIEQPEQPEHSDDEVIHDTDESGDDAPNDDNSEDTNQPDKPDDGDKPDYQNKFERLRKKQSKVEKEKSELARKVELLERNLELSQLQKQPANPTQSDDSDTNTPEQTATTQDVDSYFEDNLGDDWRYMDDSSKRVYRLIAKQALENKDAGESQVDIDKIVASKLQEQKQIQKLNQFTKDLDGYVKSIDPDTDFTQVVNEVGFDDYLAKNRVHKAMFIEASRNIDDDSKQMMQDVLNGYLGKQSVKPTPSSETAAPNVNTKSKPSRPQKKETITQAEIDKAIRDSKVPSRRKTARKVLRKAQELGLI